MNKFLLLVVSLFFSFVTGYAQCNVVKNGDFTGSIASPWVSTVTPSTTTGWYYNSTYFPNEAYIETDNVVSATLKQPLTGLLGSSLTLSFKVKGQNYNLSSTTASHATLEIWLGGTKYASILNPDSNSIITTGNITLFGGATFTNTPSGFPISTVNPLGQGTVTLTIPWSSKPTSANLEFIQTLDTGDDWALDDIVLTAPLPAANNVTGSNVCFGTSTTVGLSGSQLGVNYQLMNGASTVGTAVAGTGAAFNFTGTQSASGTYTVVATNAGSASCTVTMTGSVVISPVSAVGAVTGTQTICNGSSPTSDITIASNTGTIQWQRADDSAFTIGLINLGTNSRTLTIAEVGALTATKYFRAVVTSGTCSSINSGTATVTVRPLFSVTSVSVPTSQCVSTATVTVNGTPTGLPVGTYTVTYFRSDPWATGLTATMTVTTAGTGTFTATGLTNPDNAGTTITVTNLASGSCSNAISANNVSNTFVMRAPSPVPTGLTGYSSGSCNSYTMQWFNDSPRVDNYYLDVSTDSFFGSFLTGYNSKDKGTAISDFISGLSPGIPYYFRLRSANVCGTTSTYSATQTFTLGAVVAAIRGGTTNVCVGATPPHLRTQQQEVLGLLLQEQDQLLLHLAE
jgi:hypothetical protein